MPDSTPHLDRETSHLSDADTSTPHLARAYLLGLLDRLDHQTLRELRIESVATSRAAPVPPDTGTSGLHLLSERSATARSLLRDLHEIYLHATDIHFRVGSCGDLTELIVLHTGTVIQHTAAGDGPGGSQLTAVTTKPGLMEAGQVLADLAPPAPEHLIPPIRALVQF